MFDWVLNAPLNQNKIEMGNSNPIDLFLVRNLLIKTSENVVYL